MQSVKTPENYKTRRTIQDLKEYTSRVLKTQAKRGEKTVARLQFIKKVISSGDMKKEKTLSKNFIGTPTHLNKKCVKQTVAK